MPTERAMRAAEEVTELCFCRGAENRLLRAVQRDAAAIIARHTRDGELREALEDAIQGFIMVTLSGAPHRT